MTKEQADTYYPLRQIGWYAVDNDKKLTIVLPGDNNTLIAHLEADGSFVPNDDHGAHADFTGEAGY